MEVMSSSSDKTVRIRINTAEQQRPVVFNYRQLYKRELKKTEDLPKDFVPPAALDAAGGGDFYEELLKKAEKYAMVDDNDDEEDEEENTTVNFIIINFFSCQLIL